MRFPLSWLKEYLPLDLSVKELSDTLTLGGIEVDSASKGEYSFSGVVVGLIEKAEVHPEQKRLKIATVFDGKERALVVCAASNCISGMKAPFAKVGAILEDEKGEKKMVKKEKLHRVDSSGMLCSEKELKLSDVGDRLMELSSDAPLGEELASYLSEVIFEVSLTPNLGHCLSIVGIARELAALLDQNIHLPKVEIKENGKESTQEAISVTIKDQKECPRYCLRQVKNVKIGPSPHWLKKRLEECGMRSINNVVDVTNFVMLEYGEPLHAFDASKLKTKKIIVAQTSKKLPFVSLDQIERVVPEETLMIWDGDKPIAIAGIIGGLNSEVDEKTTDIFLEAAHFTSELIRKGSKKMQLRSESSNRFERGVDPEILPKALDRAASLIQILAGGEISKGTIDTRKTALKPKVLLCHVKRVNQLLGTSLSLSEIETFFMRLGMKISQRTEENLHVSIPSYRNDIVSEIDLIEEIARIYGYNNIERSHPKVTLSALSHSPLYNIEKEVRRGLIAEGLQEFLTCDLISPKLAALSREKSFPKKNEIHVLSPSSIDQSILRTTLLPGLLQATRHNFDHKNFDLSTFEIGRIHFKEKNECIERSTAAILLCGKRSPLYFGDKGKEVDFFDLKGMIQSLFIQLGVEKEQYVPSSLETFHPHKQSFIQINGLCIGSLGEVHPNRLAVLDLQSPVFFAEIDLHHLMAFKKPFTQMVPLPLYPSSERDWTITLKKETPLSNLLPMFAEISSILLKKVILLDLYENPALGEDRKNLTFRLTYRQDDKTVEQWAVDQEHERILGYVNNKIREFNL